MTNQLVLAHALIYGSCISLHEPVAHRMPDSARKSAEAAQNIIKILKTFIAARVDLLQIGSLMTLMIVLAARAVTRQYKKTRREAAHVYLRLRRQHPELFARAAEAGYADSSFSAGSSASSSNKNPASGATYNPMGMGLDTSVTDAIDQEEAAAVEGVEAGNNISTAGFSDTLEGELEFALDSNAALSAQIDPEGQLAALRDDLELIFWSLVKYGETYPLGVGQAKVVAQLLGKDYSSELEQSGLFRRTGESSGSASDVGSLSDHSNPASFGAASVAGGSVPMPPQHQSGAQGGQVAGNAGSKGVAGAGVARSANADPAASLFHLTEGGYRLGSFYLDRPQVSDYYPAHPLHK